MGSPKTTMGTRLQTALTSLDDTLKARFLGIGFVWAWIYCSFETSALYPERQGIGINADPSWLASAAAVTAALLITGVAWRNRNLARMRWAHLAAPAFVAIGTVLSAIATLAEPPLAALQCASGMLSGIGSGWLCILWTGALSRLDIEQIEVIVPAASFVTLLCTLAFPHIEGIPGVIAVASLPVASGALLLLSFRQTERRKRTPSAAERAAGGIDFGCLTVVVRASAVLCAAYFAIGCLGAMGNAEDPLQAQWGFDVPTFIGSASGIAMALCFILFTVRIDFASLFRWLTPLMVLALALFSWREAAPSFVSNAIVSVADTSMQVITYLYVISLAKRRRLPVSLGVGITQGAVQLGVLAGNLSGDGASELVATDGLSVFSLALALICLLSFAMLLVPQRNLRPLSAAKTASTRPETSRIDLLCSQLSQENGLSARETEILGYLARGRSQPYIREELMLSKNTVATHVKHLYQKLNVHSRQELLDLFEER
ncbi:hypothetical protein B5F40_02090 [Gordonibacter sp. An230]|uniref:helix-turn-helix transcriptional regulator n=1 Tax=Gordonibacter sp. An230 TaxID=1965592 RepID=UPI000B37A208|nr:LuxR family transcriptional regulator [Gordonibacter sp. An230]OUO92140.1 hypothetical protein B5F40_02090 [Gordonibacter sp. An230]